MQNISNLLAIITEWYTCTQNVYRSDTYTHADTHGRTQAPHVLVDELSFLVIDIVVSVDCGGIDIEKVGNSGISRFSEF